jgi:hypothetical protein
MILFICYICVYVDDISKYAYDEIISSVIGIDDSKKYITGELMLMAGRQCVPSCVLLPNIDVPQFVATGVIHDPTAVAVSPTKSAAGSRRSSLSPKQSDKPSPPPAKRSSISILSFGSSSSSSLTEPPAPPVPTTEKPRKTGEAYFIHDDNFVLLAVPDKTKLEQGIKLCILNNNLTMHSQHVYYIVCDRENIARYSNIQNR